MKVNSNSQIVLVDVDDTLITFKDNGCPPLKLERDGAFLLVYPLNKNIQFLKECFIRGFYIRVHSKGGHNWAAIVVELLGLSGYVHSIESKPHWYLDDKSADEWMERVFKDDL